jgi:hypothetical protein
MFLIYSKKNIGVIIMTRVEFEKEFDVLCKCNVNWNHTPSVGELLTGTGNGYKGLIDSLVTYFMESHGTNRSLGEVKLQEFVNFIRDERNKKFNYNCKVSKRKFISTYFSWDYRFKRSSTLKDYYTHYLLKDC